MQEDKDEQAFLADWTHQEWTQLFDYCQTLRYGPGDVLVNCGDATRALYMVAAGQFEVVMPAQDGRPARQVHIVETGSIIGELSFLDGQPRSTDVLALTESEVMRLSLNAFEIFAEREPERARAILWELGRLASLRLRDTMRSYWTE